MPQSERRIAGDREQNEEGPCRTRHGVTVSTTESCLPEMVAVTVDVWVDDTFFAVTVDVAALALPVDVMLLDGEIVAAPLALQLTVRP